MPRVDRRALLAWLALGAVAGGGEACKRKRRLADVKLDDVTQMVAKQGLTVVAKLVTDSPPTMTVSWTDSARGNSWSLQVQGVDKGVKESERVTFLMQYLSTMVRSIGKSMSVVYGHDGETCAVLYGTLRETLTQVFDEIFHDVAFTVRGDTFGGGDPLGPYEASHQSATPTATRFADLTGEDIAARVRKAGGEILSIYPTAVGVTVVSFMSGGKSGSVTIAKHDSGVILAKMRELKLPIAYALSGEIMVYSFGDSTFASKEYLAKLLDGLGADVREQHP